MYFSTLSCMIAFDGMVRPLPRGLSYGPKTRVSKIMRLDDSSSSAFSRDVRDENRPSSAGIWAGSDQAIANSLLISLMVIVLHN
jgi:hypothetical protein